MENVKLKTRKMTYINMHDWAPKIKTKVRTFSLLFIYKSIISVVTTANCNVPLSTLTSIKATIFTE